MLRKQRGKDEKNCCDSVGGGSELRGSRDGERPVPVEAVERGEGDADGGRVSGSASAGDGELLAGTAFSDSADLPFDEREDGSVRFRLEFPAAGEHGVLRPRRRPVDDSLGGADQVLPEGRRGAEGRDPSGTLRTGEKGPRLLRAVLRLGGGHQRFGEGACPFRRLDLHREAAVPGVAVHLPGGETAFDFGAGRTDAPLRIFEGAAEPDRTGRGGLRRTLRRRRPDLRDDDQRRRDELPLPGGRGGDSAEDGGGETGSRAPSAALFCPDRGA